MLLHVEQPQLGAGQLRRLAASVLGFSAVRETFRMEGVSRRQLDRARAYRAGAPLDEWPNRTALSHLRGDGVRVRGDLHLRQRQADRPLR